jgi:hypothetical protein
MKSTVIWFPALTRNSRLVVFNNFLMAWLNLGLGVTHPAGVNSFDADGAISL